MFASRGLLDKIRVYAQHLSWALHPACTGGKRTKKLYSILTIAVCFGTLLHADTVFYDRGLPTANLNNAAEGLRSNVAWAYGVDPEAYWAVGDTFNLGSAGTYGINDFRVWVVGAVPSTLTLWGGGTTDPATINPIASTVSVQLAAYNDPAQPLETTYQGYLGPYRNIYQVDFLNLNWTVNGNQDYSFFVTGVAGQTGPFLHASNAALSGSPQQGSDNQMLWAGFDPGITAVADFGVWDSNAPNTWDKSSDINVQIFAATPEPGSILLFGTLLVGVGAIVRKRKSA